MHLAAIPASGLPDTTTSSPRPPTWWNGGFLTSKLRGELRGTTTLLPIHTARRVLGHEPRHSWRDKVLPDGGA